MKALKIIVIIVLSFLAVFFIGGIFLPKTYSVQRSTVINAPDSTIYDNICDFNEFIKWNPWSKMDPEARMNVSGVPKSPGHMYLWDGKETGKGEMKIISLAPYQFVDIELRFIEPIPSVSQTKFEIQPADGSHKVTWTMSGENEGTMGKWMCLMMDSMIGKDFEAGLASLKQKSEGK